MSAFKHFDVARYLEEAKLEPQVRDPAKTAKAAKDAPRESPNLATLATLAGVRDESSNLEGASKSSLTPAEAKNYPAEWAAGFVKMCSMPCPKQIRSERWLALVHSTADFLDSWAGQAAALGWGTLDLFGCCPSGPDQRYDYAGLIWFLSDRDIAALTESDITLRTQSGSIQKYRKHVGALPGQVLVWEL